MTQDRRITDKFPGQPLQWEEAGASAPAAGQAGLATKITDIDSAREYLVKFSEQHFSDNTFHRYIRGEHTGGGLAGDFAWQLAKALESMAAPVAADTEQASIDTPEFSALLANFTEANERLDAAEGRDVFDAVDKLGKSRAALIGHIDSVKLTPLATPADAGAGTEQAEADLDAYERLCQKKDAEIASLRAEVARLSTPSARPNADCSGDPSSCPDNEGHGCECGAGTPGAQVTAPNGWTIEEVEGELRVKKQGKSGIVPRRNGETAAEQILYELASDIVARQSPAPVTAGPVAEYIGTLRSTLHAIGNTLDDHELRQHALAAYALPVPATPAPADRDAIRAEALEEAAKACDVIGKDWAESGDQRKEVAAEYLAKWIRALKSMERAADATDEQPNDKALLDHLDAWVAENKKLRNEWFSFGFDTRSTAREQIAAHMEMRAADAAETRDAKGEQQ